MNKLFFALLMLLTSVSYSIPKIEREIVRDEGLVFKSYMDTEGYLTGGVGHKLTREEALEYPLGTSISPSKVREWFIKDLAKAREIVDSAAPDVPLEVRDILTNMSFNLGRKGFLGFKKMLGHVNNEDYRNACKEMQDSVWASQVPNRANRLIARMCSFESSKLSGGYVKPKQTEFSCRVGYHYWGQAGECQHTSRFNF